MDEKGLKIFMAVLQSIIVILLVYFLSFVRETELERSSMVILYLLHFFVFYVSSYGNNFFKRGYLVE
ncbi:TPA: sugar transferase, partial [Streptococcus pneumoniae]